MASKTVQRRLLEPALSSSLNSICPSCRFASIAISHVSRRYASGTIGKFRNPIDNPNAHLEKYNQAPKKLLERRKDKKDEKHGKDGVEAKPKRTRKVKKETSVGGLPSENSVFDDPAPKEEEEELEEDEEGEKAAKPVHEEIDHDALQNVLDPEPGKTMAWKRKKLIQTIRKRGYLTKEEQIKRTERECTVSSAMFQTSTKKLVHLARQIAGKPIDDAIIQMRLSKKRVAQDIMKHLEYAKNLAIVSRGMGLGKVEERMGEPLEIETKEGKRMVVKDQTGIYIDEAWVNKGEETMTPEYRGRGRVFRHTHRTAKITVTLKEEATRIRLSQEKQEKLLNRKLWLHLPDRPITLQRQYPLW